MQKLVITLLKFLIPILMIYLCFRYNFWIGVLSIVVFVAYSFYKGRGGIYASLGNIQYAKGNVQRSMVWLERAYHTPNCPAKYVNAYGYLLLKSGDLEQAEQIFLRLLDSKPARADEMSVRLNMAMVIWKKGNVAEATEKTREIYDDYKNSLVYSVLGYFLILEGDLEKALLFNLKAYEYNNTNHVIMDNLGQTYYLLGSYEKADEIYEKLIPLSPVFPEAYYNYGLVLHELQQSDKSIEYMQKSLNYNFSLLSTVSVQEIKDKIAALSVHGHTILG